MPVGENVAVDRGLMQALVRHLEHLERHPDGGDLLERVKDALQQCRVHGLVNGSCLIHLHQLLSGYAQQLDLPASIRLRARLMQQHIALFLPRPPRINSAAANRADHPRSAQRRIAETRRTETAAARNPSAANPRAASPSGTPTTLDQWRQQLMRGMDEMLHEREALSRKLNEATTYLKMVEAEREQLRAELNKARRRQRPAAPAVKKVNGLPKRDALVRQLATEVERVKRHGEPLALALIDIDDFEDIQQRHGPEIADTVLNSYTTEVLGRFRRYDLVARYSAREFAVLLPNTGKDNALRALEKVQKRVKESHFSHNGVSYPLPGFGGVLSVYSPGEEPQQWLRRADAALVNLKLRGERQLVIV